MEACGEVLVPEDEIPLIPNHLATHMYPSANYYNISVFFCGEESRKTALLKAKQHVEIWFTKRLLTFILK